MIHPARMTTSPAMSASAPDNGGHSLGRCSCRRQPVTTFVVASSTPTATTTVFIINASATSASAPPPPTAASKSGAPTPQLDLGLRHRQHLSTTVFAVFDNGNAPLAGTLTQNSDQRLKTNIQASTAQARSRRSTHSIPSPSTGSIPTKTSVPQFGFIAQQVQGSLPEPRLDDLADRAHARWHPRPQLHRPHLPDRRGDPGA